MALKNFKIEDYEPVIATSKLRSGDVRIASASRPRAATLKNDSQLDTAAECPAGVVVGETWSTKSGHKLTFAGVFVFTFLVYFRPYELFPSLSWLSKSAFVAALLTLVIFIPTQLALENRLTARPREVALALFLLLTGLLSIPFALEPTTAIQSFIEFLKVVLMFIVLVNVLRTEKRLRILIALVLCASCVLSIAALNDYIHGNLALQGRRIAGLIGGLFSNPNDLALHLVTMIPISAALMFGSRGPLKKLAYFSCSLVLTLGLVATFSRGGFLGFICVVAFSGWKLARRNRALFGVIALLVVAATLVLAPGAYRSRISNASDDSAIARTDDLKRSLVIAARHPFFGVGMDNYILYSNTNKATHNAYTQVASEMGIAALLIYLTFLITPFRKLRLAELSNPEAKRRSPLQYLAIGLQASLLGYMVGSFFASVAYLWYVYYLVAYSICLRRIASTQDSVSNKSDVPSLVTAKHSVSYAASLPQVH
ncbi:MAG TPA: O-antigen ligase family protein [Pyrinomonadaceae bacterium]|nr:O-antigen ligase family protein [Pyrinomonadaceae bacterium]